MFFFHFVNIFINFWQMSLHYFCSCTYHLHCGFMNKHTQPHMHTGMQPFITSHIPILTSTLEAIPTEGGLQILPHTVETQIITQVFNALCSSMHHVPLLTYILGNENQLIYLLISLTVLGKGIAILFVCLFFSAKLCIGFGVIYSHRVGFIPRPLHR